MVGQQFATLETLAGVGLLHGGAGLAVELAAARAQHAVVGDIPGQRVLEYEGSLDGTVPFAEELQVLQLL